MRKTVVTGAAGFIGGHLVAALKRRGDWVRGVDIGPPGSSAGTAAADEFRLLDLRDPTQADRALRDAHDVYHLAADMGGMGYISGNQSRILRDNTLIDVNTFDAGRANRVDRFLYTSSACVYAERPRPLREEDAFPAQPQDAYGWEKLFGELMVRYGGLDHSIDTRVARLHNVYGPRGAWRGGREKAPAALCRKVAHAPAGGNIEIWGDGEQTRSFCFVDDCVEGLLRLMDSGRSEPLNIGSDRLVSITRLAEMIIEISGKRGLSIVHVPGPQGVRERNSDNSRLREALGWTPSIGLEQGLTITYRWIEEQVRLAAMTEALIA